MGITVLDGDFQTSNSIKVVPGGIEYMDNAKRLIPEKRSALIDKVEFVDAKSSGNSGFSPLWAIAGEEVIGPAGLLLGVNTKKPGQTVYFKCTLKDGRYFIGSTSAKEFQRLRNLAAQPPLTRSQRLMNDFFGPFVIVPFVILLLFIICYLFAH